LNAEALSRIRALILEKAARTRLPSVTFTAVRGGEEAYLAIGFRDAENALPADAETLYCVGSVTKSFTCLALLKLEEEGLLSLDDPVGSHLPLDLRVRGEPVRLRHLMTHTSGIPALGYAEALLKGLVGEPDSWLPASKPSDVLAFMEGAEEWAEASPGEKFFYLNEGYVLLGEVIERVSGVPYEEYMEREVLRPLGMSRSTFRREAVERDGNVARPYLLADGGLTPGRFPWGIMADGGLWSCATDLAKYLRFLMGEGPSLAPRSRLEDAFTPRVGVPWRFFGDESYGYGWLVTGRFFGRRLVSHGGSVLVYTAWVGLLPEEKLGVALLANGEGYPLSTLGMSALAVLLGEEPGELPQVRVGELLDRLCGVYEGFKGVLKAEVRRIGNSLLLELSGRHVRFSAPLFYEGSEGRVHSFSAGAGATKMEVEFREEERGVVLLYERYKLVKRG